MSLSISIEMGIIHVHSAHLEECAKRDGAKNEVKKDHEEVKRPDWQ